MNRSILRRGALGVSALALAFAAARTLVVADPPAEARKAFIDGTGPGWRELTGADFTHVNLNEDTWTWNGGEAHCTGSPVGVTRMKEPLKNFEMVAEWRHTKPGGNSGIFVWGIKENLDSLKPNQLPHGIEVQVLDLGYTAEYEKSGKKADWFTCHGDVFPCGDEVKMTPFPPVAPDGRRSFPRKSLSKGINEWNHYYIRAINGEVRLWVNGEEVSGGTAITPASGYLCLESEGAPVDFKNLRIRELP